MSEASPFGVALVNSAPPNYRAFTVYGGSSMANVNDIKEKFIGWQERVDGNQPP